MARTWNTAKRATSVRGALFLLLVDLLVVDLVVCVGRFVGMEVLGCWNLDLGVSAVETTIERV
jgi:hypothetical protein